jgi:hypothetical protein
VRPLSWRGRRLRSRLLAGLSLLLYALGFASYLWPPEARPSWVPGYAAGSTTINLPLALFSLIIATYLLVLAGASSPRRRDPVQERQRELEQELARLLDSERG